LILVVRKEKFYNPTLNPNR